MASDYCKTVEGMRQMPFVVSPDDAFRRYIRSIMESNPPVVVVTPPAVTVALPETILCPRCRRRQADVILREGVVRIDCPSMLHCGFTEELTPDAFMEKYGDTAKEPS